MTTDLSVQHFDQHFGSVLASVAFFHLFTPLLSEQLSPCLFPHLTDHPQGSAHPSDPLHTLCLRTMCADLFRCRDLVTMADISRFQQPGLVFLNNKTHRHTHRYKHTHLLTNTHTERFTRSRTHTYTLILHQTVSRLKSFSHFRMKQEQGSQFPAMYNELLSCLSLTHIHILYTHTHVDMNLVVWNMYFYQEQRQRKCEG